MQAGNFCTITNSLVLKFCPSLMGLCLAKACHVVSENYSVWEFHLLTPELTLF